MSRRIIAAALVIGLIGPAAAVELNPKAIAIKQADELPWRDPTGAAPVNQKVLFGDPSKPGTCELSYALKCNREWFQHRNIILPGVRWVI